LLADEIATAWPGLTLVDGGPGIARRIAYLTTGQPWPDQPSPGIAVFTAPPSPALTQALARFGLDRIDAL
jgi:glutamate racemase